MLLAQEKQKEEVVLLQNAHVKEGITYVHVNAFRLLDYQTLTTNAIIVAKPICAETIHANATNVAVKATNKS